MILTCMSFMDKLALYFAGGILLGSIIGGAFRRG